MVLFGYRSELSLARLWVIHTWDETNPFETWWFCAETGGSLYYWDCIYLFGQHYHTIAGAIMGVEQPAVCHLRGGIEITTAWHDYTGFGCHVGAGILFIRTHYEINCLFYLSESVPKVSF
jgi:hypothetical protein